MKYVAALFMVLVWSTLVWAVRVLYSRGSLPRWLEMAIDTLIGGILAFIACGALAVLVAVGLLALLGVDTANW